MVMTGTHTYRNPNNGKSESAVVAAPVIKMYDYATGSGKDGYVCLGVVGNHTHLTAKVPGDHTWFSKHITIRVVGGAAVAPKHGWIYAGDWHVPDPEKFEKWLLARLRAGVYISLVKYFNILNRHWNRKAVRSGKMFAYSSYSGDPHLHLSWMPGAEYAIVDLFGDYEHYRTTGKNRTPSTAAQPPAKAGTPAKPHPAKAAAAKLPLTKKGAKTRAVRILQAALVAQGYWPPADASKVIDGDFGTGTETKVKKFQTDHKLKATGVVDAATWNALMPDAPPVVQRGSEGYYTRLAQCLLIAWSQNPGYPDSQAGDMFLAALKKFQVARKVTNSIVKGKPDGIGGAATWVAFLTV